MQARMSFTVTLYVVQHQGWSLRRTNFSGAYLCYDASFFQGSFTNCVISRRGWDVGCSQIIIFNHKRGVGGQAINHRILLFDMSNDTCIYRDMKLKVISNQLQLQLAASRTRGYLASTTGIRSRTSEENGVPGDLSPEDQGSHN